MDHGSRSVNQIKLLDCFSKKNPVFFFFFFLKEVKLLDFVSTNQNFPNGTSSNRQIEILNSLESCRASFIGYRPKFGVQ